ncbi:MAG TPA: hypothetical protein VNS46_12580 [Nocardioides sp.]|nr:hypothetical protein [Nocardioides sp.]
MTTDSISPRRDQRTAPPSVPSPLEVATRFSREAAPEPGGRVRQLECLACERETAHVTGPATYGRNGELLVQWWTCTECEEGRTVG